MLSAADIAACQATMNASMDATLTVDRPTNSDGVWGQNVENWALGVLTGVPCLIHDVSESMMVQVGQSSIVGVIQGFEIWFANGTDIRINDRLTLSTGPVLRVQSTHNQRSVYFMLDGVFATEAV
jgi:hypothetical protein